jgi:hypothetical protein
LAVRVVLIRLAKAGRGGDVEGIAHDMASGLVADLIRRNGFAVRNFRAFLSLKYSQGETSRTVRRREGREAGEVIESMQDPRERADGIADAVDAPHFIEEILEHHAGAYLVYFLAVGRSLRSALREGEAAGVPRAWMRDNAPQLVGVWRVLHDKGDAVTANGSRDRRRPIRGIQDAIDFARRQGARQYRSLDKILYSTGGRSKEGGQG